MLGLLLLFYKAPRMLVSVMLRVIPVRFEFDVGNFSKTFKFLFLVLQETRNPFAPTARLKHAWKSAHNAPSLLLIPKCKTL